MASPRFMQGMKSWLKRKLGDCWVQVELTTDQLQDAVDDAMLWWSSLKGWYKENTLTISSGKVDYDLSAVTPEITDIVKIWFPLDPSTDLSTLWPGFLDVNGWPYHTSPFHRGNQIYSGIAQTYQYLNTAARVMSADADYIFDRESRELVITPIPRDGGTALYRFETPFLPEYLDELKPRDQFLLKRYILAEAMETLGRVRGKYDSYPAAQGNVSLDGRDLLDQAREMKEKLEEELIMGQGAPVMVVG